MSASVDHLGDHAGLGRPADRGRRPWSPGSSRPTTSSPAGSRFYCDAITPVGEGRLLARLEQTKRLLQAEGLFDPARRSRCRSCPAAVGLITGADSAAERDVVENARRRWPAVRLAVRHALVQGPQAAEQMIAAVAALDRQPEVDVIVIARGGGSLEDLLPFSDEGLVRAVSACRTPVVSAIGHESDNPILDLVADLPGLHPDRRRQAGGARCGRRDWPGSRRPGSGCARGVTSLVAAPAGAP